MAGYSHRTLSQKLGIKPEMTLCLDQAPDIFLSLISPLPESIVFTSKNADPISMAIVFYNKYDALKNALVHFQDRLKPKGIIWVAWYKKASGKQDEVTEDVIREIALPMGLVDIKVCAIDSEWSGLKVVKRKVNT